MPFSPDWMNGRILIGRAAPDDRNRKRSEITLTVAIRDTSKAAKAIAEHGQCFEIYTMHRASPSHAPRSVGFAVSDTELPFSSKAEWCPRAGTELVWRIRLIARGSEGSFEREWAVLRILGKRGPEEEVAFLVARMPRSDEIMETEANIIRRSVGLSEWVKLDTSGER